MNFGKVITDGHYLRYMPEMDKIHSAVKGFIKLIDEYEEEMLLCYLWEASPVSIERLHKIIHELENKNKDLGGGK
jgi:hypothetical protein